MVEHYFLYPFGTAGTLASVPNPTQVSGTVSYQSGFPIGYQTASSDPGYLSIPRDQFNQILYDITGAIQQIQQTGFPSWITAAANGGVSYSYPLGAEVWYNGVPYRSLQAGNTDTPPTSNWQVLGQNRSLYFNYAADTGSANHYVIAPDPAIAAYAGGQVVQLRPAFGNTGACDINVNSLGVKNIKTLANVDPAAGMINPAGQYQLVYNDNTGCFVLQNPTLGSAAYLNVGTSANQIVQLTAGAVIPNGLGVVKSVKKQMFTAGGTYTPSAGMLFCIAEIQAAGGGGGGTNGTDAQASGGGSGAYAKAVLSAATIGVSQAVTVGAAGTGGANTGANGGTGGTSALGALITATGGIGGTGSTATVSTLLTGGAGGSSSGGDVNGTGQPGGPSLSELQAGVLNNTGFGGNSAYGGGGASLVHVGSIATGAGNAATGYGAGGGGSGGTSATGGAGTQGFVYITEFCSQ